MEQVEWRSKAPRGATLHQAARADVVTFCGRPVNRFPCRAPVDPARGTPVGACRRCRAATGPYGWRSVEDGLRVAGPDGRRSTITE